MSRRRRGAAGSFMSRQRRVSRADFLRLSGVSLGVLAVPGILGACGGGGSDANTIRYFSMWNEGEPQQVVLQRIIEEYQEANPDITIDVLWGGREVLTTVRSALAEGNPPDLVDKDAEELVGSLIYTEQAEPLDDMAGMTIPGEDNTIGDVVPEDYLDLLAYQGSRYVMPYEVLSSGIWYDQQQFSELGVQPVGNWDELFDLNAEIDRQGTSPFTVDGNYQLYNAYWFYWLAQRFAGPEAFRAAAGDESGESWDQEALANAAREVERFVDSGALASGYEGNSYPQAQTSWAEGNAAMYLNGTWMPSETAEFEVEHRMFEFPQVEGGYDSAEIYLIGWSIPRGAANVDAAKDFMAFALNQERLRGISEEADNITSRPDIPAPEVLRDAEEILNSGRPVHRVYDGIQAVHPSWWEQVFFPLNADLFFGGISGDEFISRIQEQSTNFWRRN